MNDDDQLKMQCLQLAINGPDSDTLNAAKEYYGWLRPANRIILTPEQAEAYDQGPVTIVIKR